ncbi:MAG TPA: hypothetical protein DCY75_00995 [Clostridiales bacterium]|nr:hypothetical protein [Clostridiales bacterium]
MEPIAYYASATNLFVDDQEEIAVFDSSMRYLGSIKKDFTNVVHDGLPDRIGSIDGIAATGDYIFIHDVANKRILMFSATFAFVGFVNETFETETNKTATFKSIDGIRVDGDVFLVYDATAGKAYSFGFSSRYWVETLPVEKVTVTEENEEGSQENEEDQNLKSTDFTTWSTVESFVGVTAFKEKSSKSSYEKGYVAIITEGEALAKIWATSAGKNHSYCTVYAQIFPSQTDTYPLSGLSVSGNASTETASTKRSYKGNFTFVYKMLYGDHANYVGMAIAYREHLVKAGNLKKLESVKEDAIMYLELFGDLDTTQRVFGVPVEVKTPLTTFEQAQSMLDELQNVGISNMVVRYKGWMNGGMLSTVPAKLKVESKIGGEDGLQAFMKYADSKGIALYPDMNYSYILTQSMFDGFSKKDAAQSIDGRTALLKKYNPAAQTYLNRGSVLISSRVMEDYFLHIADDYKKMGMNSISLGTLGEILNSDHNKDEPLNRENSKDKVIQFLKTVKENKLNVLVEKGNSYTLSYADHVLNLSLDSSNNTKANESVPFMGIVLHGYLNFAGEAINLAGDYRYNLLKTIENGADIYFVLSYENTAELKNSRFNAYYSVDYNTWMGRVTDGSESDEGKNKLNTVESVYKHLNEALKLVKTATIVKHEFVNGISKLVRVTYDNGVVFLLNYTDSEVEMDGVTVAMYDFAVVS